MLPLCYCGVNACQQYSMHWSQKQPGDAMIQSPYAEINDKMSVTITALTQGKFMQLRVSMACALHAWQHLLEWREEERGFVHRQFRKS